MQSANGALAKHVFKFIFTNFQDPRIFFLYKQTQFFSVDSVKMGLKGICCAYINSTWLGMWGFEWIN